MKVFLNFAMFSQYLFLHLLVLFSFSNISFGE
jgi:hypothetical protein